jgi:hypothetical protein
MAATIAGPEANQPWECVEGFGEMAVDAFTG